MSSPTAGNTNFGGQDITTATEFLNDLMNATSGVLLDQFGRLSNIIQQLRQGSYTPTQFQMDLSRMWDPLIAMVAFPFQWATSDARPLATMLFVVDQVAETVGPIETPTNISVPPGLTPVVNELNQIGGNLKFDKKHVEAEFTPEGNRVSIKLIALGSGPTARQQNGIEPGLYAGAVYVKELATPRPLAIIYVLVE
jgi:hypothetical protein